MKKIETVDDFRDFLNANRNRILENAVKIEELPADDKWIMDKEWDEIYNQEVVVCGKV